MVEMLANLLSKILLPMGVSYADILVYLNAVSRYLTVILLAFIILIIALMMERKVKKGWRWFVRSQSVVAYLVLIVICVDAVCYGPLKATLSAYLNASSVELADDVVAQSLDTIQKIGEEGIVLLKNDNNVLPLSKSVEKLNVFGWAATQPYVGGTGSSASSAAPAVDILQSLEDAGYTYNQNLIDMYTSYAKERPGADMFGQNMTLPEPVADAYTDEIMEDAKNFSDTAVVVIARGGGENYDLPTDMHAVIDGSYDVSDKVSIASETYPYTKMTYTNNGDYDDFDEGESYLELSNTEEDLLKLVTENFEHVIAIINSNNAMELGWLNEYKIDGALLVPAAGAKGFEAIGEILNGSVNPSGRTVDTYVYDVLNTPSVNHAGINTYSNTEELRKTILDMDTTYQGTISFVNYAEGIYTGYKYYETAADDGVINYEDHVQYPFGYGMSYTSFEKKIIDFSENADEIKVTVSVKNTGAVAGKDVVELYYTPPYTNGGIEKASVNLIDFAKTDELEPGASELLYFSLSKEDMASYDYSCKKTTTGGYVLEAGEYEISLRADSHTVCDSRTFTEKEDTDYSKTGRKSDVIPAVNQFEETNDDFSVLSRANGFANYEETCGAKSVQSEYKLDEEDLKAVAANTVAEYNSSDYENSEDEMPKMGIDNGLTLADMVDLDYNDPKWDELLDELSWDDMNNLVNQGGWSTVEVDSIGKIKTSDSDGPAGLNNYMTNSYGTTYPSEVLMAQTWDKELAEEIGLSMGSEFAAAENYGWYGPAVNIHRSAFGGRNFEYFSEDAVLSGKMGAGEVNGAAQFGVYAYVKHFALNEQELNRTAMLLTWADEQTIREGYLKAFEIVLKSYEGKSIGIMSSYNWIGTQPAGACSALLNNVLRAEWGFQGMVISDYDGSYGFMITDNYVRNGGDLMLGFGTYDSNKLDKKMPTLANAMRTASKNILYTVANSGYYAGKAEIDTVDHMDEIFRQINIIFMSIFVGIEIMLILLRIFGFRKNKKQNM